MPSIANYHTIQDDPITLNFFGNEEKFVVFDAPDDMILANNGVFRPILSYRVDPSGDASNLVFKVFIRQSNGTDVEVSGFTLSGTVSRTVFEIIKGSNLHKGEQKIIFRIQGGTGSVKVSDVIFWITRKV